MTLSWGTPTFKAPGSSIQYKVEVYKETCNQLTTPLEEKRETGSQVTFQGLKAASLYCINVEAIDTKISTSHCYLTQKDKTRQTLNCHHKSSVRISATTNPSPPTGLIVKHVGDSSVKLEWRKSIIPPGETLVNYVIEYMKVDSKTKQPLTGATMSSFKSDQETATVSALPSGVTYLFKVKVCFALSSNIFLHIDKMFCRW